MSDDLSIKYPHLTFQKNWNITDTSWLLLGQCQAYIEAITNTPILPDHHQQLLKVSLIKGAIATTAIEGNTLSEEEVAKIQQGDHLPPSKEYQEIEVRNILEAYNELLMEVVYNKTDRIISPELLLFFHKLIGKNLGKHFDAIPGRFREDNRIVGQYRCPDYQDIKILIDRYCNWLITEFHYDKGQFFAEIIIQAIVSHIYLEWIHPFGDGNGRTGRLLEFYILLRGGNPDIASHILSNHYNQTRSEYYRQIHNANIKRNLTEFIEYALVGLRDGLKGTLTIIQSSQFQITWQKLVYDKFADKKYRKKDIYKRQRSLILALPPSQEMTVNQIRLINPEIAVYYAGKSERTVLRDIKELINLGLLNQNNKVYSININLLRGYMPQKLAKKG